MGESLVVDATTPNEYNQNTPAACGEILVLSEPYEGLRAVWYPVEPTVRSSVMPIPMPYGFFPILPVVCGLGGGSWLPPGWMDVGLAPSKVTALQSFIFCGMMAATLARPGVWEPFEFAPGKKRVVTNARQLCRLALDASADLPPFPRGPVSTMLAIDLLSHLMTLLLEQMRRERHAAAPTTLAPKHRKKNPNAARDEWIYTQYQNTNARLEDIVANLKRKCGPKKWRPIRCAQGVINAARAHAKRLGLPTPGRNDKSTVDSL